VARGGRFIYVARNPRDSFLSLYYFIHDLFGIEEWVPVDVFYREYYVERFGSGHDIGNVWDHFLSWHPHRKDENLLWLHYEDLLEDLPRCLRVIAAFMGVALDDSSIRLIEKRSKMEAMREFAGKLNPSQTNRTGRVTLSFDSRMRRYASNMKFGKLRKGVSGDGQRSLPPHIVSQLDEDWQQRITPLLGYAGYDDMRNACSLLRGWSPEEASPVTSVPGASQ